MIIPSPSQLECATVVAWLYESGNQPRETARGGCLEALPFLEISVIRR